MIFMKNILIIYINYNLFNLQNNEYHLFVPAVINYRNFYNNKIFGIIYEINYFCMDKC